MLDLISLSLSLFSIFTPHPRGWPNGLSLACVAMDSLVAGAFAGLCVDLGLYPIDTIKTRIQAKEGFIASGGFSQIYKGLSAVAVGSVPGGAAFFFAYDGVKRKLFNRFGLTTVDNASIEMNPTVFACQATAAMCGESFACCIRVPVEMVKQQLQVGHHHSITAALRAISHSHAPGVAGAAASAVEAAPSSIRWSGLPHLFTGMPIMLLRELPFAVIQMSLYEGIKCGLYGTPTLQPYYFALLPLCGAVSGGTAAFLTTPLDVVKTRIMLQRKVSRDGAVDRIKGAIREIVEEPARPGDRFGPTQKFFRGATTRVIWISLGGSIFFGTYEQVKRAMNAQRPNVVELL